MTESDGLKLIGHWEQVEAALLAHHHQPDLDAARLLYAAVAAHRLKGQPVWSMLVAPPGSMKTELVTALEGLPGVHLIDKITPNTFISGQVDEPGRRRSASPSLLHRIGPDGIIVYPDFSTVLSMNRDRRGEVLADMRRIYDGALRKEFGTSDNPKMHEWRGRITFVVAATPDVDRHYSLLQTLGERFVRVRLPRPATEAGLKAMNQDVEEAKAELHAAVRALFAALPKTDPTLPDELQQRIAALAEFTVRARTHVPRSGYGAKEILYIPEPEAPTRLAQQLAQLAKGSALLAGRKVATEDDYRLVQRAGFDCIPAVRRKVLDVLIAGEDINRAKLPVSSVGYAEEELSWLGLTASLSLSSLARDLLRQAGVL